MLVSGLEECLITCSDDEVIIISNLVSPESFFEFTIGLYIFQIQKVASGSRANDTKSLKGPILDWIIPKSQNLVLLLSRNVKVDRRFNHKHMGALLCPAGLDWSNLEYVFARPCWNCADGLQDQGEIKKWGNSSQWQSMANLSLYQLQVRSRGPMERSVLELSFSKHASLMCPPCCLVSLLV